MGEIVSGNFQANRIVVQTQHSGGDSGGPNIETRIAKLESDVENIKANLARMWDDLRDFRNEMRVDFRTLWGALIAATLGVAWLLAKGFHWV